MNRMHSVRALAVTGVTLMFFALSTATAHAKKKDIDDVIPSGADYSGVGFLTGPAKELIGNLLALTQIASLVLLVVSLLMYATSSDQNSRKWSGWMKRAGVVLVIATLFNPLLTGSFGFLDGLFN